MSRTSAAEVLNERTGASLGGRLRVADRMWGRLRGLLGHPEPAAGEGLLIEPCNGVHTVAMRYAVDVVFLSREDIVLRCERALPRTRFVPWVRRAHRVLELPAGTIESTGTIVGDRLAIRRIAATAAVTSPGERPVPRSVFERLAVAAAVGVLVGVLAQSLPATARQAVMAAPFVAAAFIDVRTGRIPNLLAALTVALALTSAVLVGDAREALLGSLVALGAGAALFVAARGSFGMGDVKLIGGAGAAIGLSRLPDFLLLMAVAGGVFALVVLAVRRDRGATMPYGPAVAAGVVLVLLMDR